MLSMFNTEKRQEKKIRKNVIQESNIIAQRSAELREKIPEETNHPIVDDVKCEGSKLAGGGALLLGKLDNLGALEKPAKKQELKTIKQQAFRYSKDVKAWNTRAITSLQMQEHGYLNMMVSPAQSGATTRNNSASTSSSTANEPYVHPANYWDCDLVDKINAAGKTPPVTLIRNRTTESEPDVY
ncbi:hypothetical protein QCA50_003893 [Cerrena zonata]|uniref:Uncharacterized protein n=1 Tax=Cerrena zonata TaxID=2478898 RepID=A0AAW0GPW5_9APHY